MCLVGPTGAAYFTYLVYHTKPILNLPGVGSLLF